MKKVYIFPVLILSAALFSCKNSSSEEADKTGTTPTNVQNVTTPVSNTPTQTAPVKEETNFTANPTTPAKAATPATTVQPATTPAATTGLNPKHGMPGHRCDIPEGAPLNSKPSSNIVPPQQAAQNAINVSRSQQAASIPQATPVTAAPAATAPGMNPEHGKPGHRCDIAVGAPLNSAPTTPAK